MRMGHGLVLACLGLAGCSGGDGSKRTETAEGGLSAEAPAAVPMLREGVWTVTTTPGENPAVVTRMCVDRAMQKRMSLLGGQLGAHCTENSVRPQAGGYAMRAVCTAPGGGQSVSEGRVTGDLNSDYRSEMTVTTTGAPMAQMNGTSRIVSTAVHGGACPADMRPGDMEMNGMRINVLDMAAAAEGATP